MGLATGPRQVRVDLLVDVLRGEQPDEPALSQNRHQAKTASHTAQHILDEGVGVGDDRRTLPAGMEGQHLRRGRGGEDGKLLTRWDGGGHSSRVSAAAVDTGAEFKPSARRKTAVRESLTGTLGAMATRGPKRRRRDNDGHLLRDFAGFGAAIGLLLAFVGAFAHHRAATCPTVAAHPAAASGQAPITNCLGATLSLLFYAPLVGALTGLMLGAVILRLRENRRSRPDRKGGARASQQRYQASTPTWPAVTRGVAPAAPPPLPRQFAPPARHRGEPGGSARREYARRRARAGNGGSEIGWLRGAEGEAMVAAYVAEHCLTVWALHDRQMPDSPTNIDHIFVAPSGIYVVDTKRYKGAISVDRTQPDNPRLVVAGRDETARVDGLDRQVTVVRAIGAQEHMSQVPVHGSFCFIDSLMLAPGTESIRGYLLNQRTQLAAQLNRPGPLSDEQIRAIIERLERRLPPAR